jgi:DNA-binding GntR family transcriptional regulator
VSRTAPATKTRPITLRQEVYERLKKDIITCDLVPGQLLNEGELAEQLEVSKTPVREALTQLKQDGLVELIPRKGYLVTTLTLRDIQEIFELRLILERAATVLAVDHITDAEIDALERYLEIDYDLNDPATVYRYIQANKDFHLEIAKAARNSRLVWHLSRVFDDAQRLQCMDLGTGGGPWAWSRDHIRILEALRRRDKEAVAAAVEDALAEARTRLLSP